MAGSPEQVLPNKVLGIILNHTQNKAWQIHENSSVFKLHKNFLSVINLSFGFVLNSNLKIQCFLVDLRHSNLKKI